MHHGLRKDIKTTLKQLKEWTKYKEVTNSPIKNESLVESERKEEESKSKSEKDESINEEIEE
jgi:hypothetical protein